MQRTSLARTFSHCTASFNADTNLDEYFSERLVRVFFNTRPQGTTILLVTTLSPCMHCVADSKGVRISMRSSKVLHSEAMSIQGVQLFFRNSQD